MVLNELVQEWLKKAEEDFGFARCCLEEPDTNYFSQICFHFQQAAEKYLKAYIVAHGLEFRKIHDLPALLKICETHNNKIGALRDSCEFLTDFYVDTRYPVFWPARVDRGETERAREAAASIREAVLRDLKRICKSNQ